MARVLQYGAKTQTRDAVAQFEYIWVLLLLWLFVIVGWLFLVVLVVGW